MNVKSAANDLGIKEYCYICVKHSINTFIIMKAINFKLLALTTITFLLLVALVMCNSASQQKSDRLPAENYRNFCAGCHGDNLEKFVDKVWMDEKGTVSVEKSIKDGIIEMGMPAFSKTFSDSEIKALAQYVKEGIPADRESLLPSVHADEVITS